MSTGKAEVRGQGAEDRTGRRSAAVTTPGAAPPAPGRCFCFMTDELRGRLYGYWLGVSVWRDRRTVTEAHKAYFEHSEGEVLDRMTCATVAVLAELVARPRGGALVVNLN